MASQNINIEEFERWKVDALKDFVRKRGFSVAQKRKKELVALVYALSLQDVPICLTKGEERKVAKDDYKSLLEFRVDGVDVKVPDPFGLSDWENEKDGSCKWPPCIWMDINAFLVDHDQQQLLTRLKNDYKEGKAFSYFASQNAWVKEVHYHEIEEHSTLCFLKCECTPSQKVTSTPHNVWVCLGKETGTIYSAYCTCFAGLGSTCNHVAALLFKLDFAWQNGLTSANKKPCTSMENKWLAPVLKTVEPMRLEEMVFAKPHYAPKKRCVKKGYAVRKLFSVSCNRKEQGPTLDEFAAVLLPEIPNAVAFQFALPEIQPDYDVCDDINVTQHETCVTSVSPPPSLTSVAKPFTSSSDFWNGLPCYTKEEVDSLEKATRDQSTSDEWKEQRAGRITASKAHHVRTKYTSGAVDKSHSPAVNKLVTSIIGKAPINPNIPALKYGRVNEPLAVSSYLSSQEAVHKGLNVTKCGLFVLPDHVYVGASPDSLVSCLCCGDGLLEVKCPFSAVNKPANAENIAYLEIFEGQTRLKPKHEYFSQMQFQMGVTGRSWCDFFVYTKSDYFLERVRFDEAHWSQLLLCATHFFENFVCPELVKEGTDK